MAAIHDLLAQIQDEALRERLQKEIEKIEKTKKFGLVFEEHLPECTPLYDIPVRRGAKVALKTEAVSEFYQVIAIKEDKVLCRKPKTNEISEFLVNDLVTIAEFGDPIYPYLKPIDTVCNAPDSDLWHTLIEADNYHALQLLEYLYKGKVDCIYIDPPYNTGAKDWKYNNDYVDGVDAYRHSKWLSFIEKRLQLSKTLLNPKGSILVVTIDEKEYLHLGCLLEELFSGATITMATDVINPRAGVARPGAFTRSQEYVFFVQIGANSNIVPEVQEGEVKKNPIWFSLMRTGSNSARADRPNLFYPIFVYRSGQLHSIGENIPLAYDKTEIKPPEDGLVCILPLRPDGRENTWQLGRETLKKAFEEGTAKINSRGDKYTVNYLRNAEKQRIESGEIICRGRDEFGALILEHNDSFGKTKAPNSVWDKASHDAGLYGSSLINAILPKRKFSFPKSLYAVSDALRFCVGNKKNALILDFFAGSGTTLHAVNLLNEEDGGKRRCILVTNNEVSEAESKDLIGKGYSPGNEEWEKLGIAHFITWPRTVCSIEGHDINGNPLKGEYIGSGISMSDGFKANASFFKLGFLDKTAVALGLRLKELLPVLWMKIGCIGKCPELADGQSPDMLIFPENRFAVLVNEQSFAVFEAALADHPEIQTVFLATDYEVNYRSMIKNLNVEHSYQLYRDYLDHFRLNRGRN